MGLEIIERISEGSDASFINMMDLTGIYKLTAPFQNLTGFGTANPNYTQVTSARLQIKFPDQVTLLPQTDFYKFADTGLDYENIYVAPVNPDPGFPNVVRVPSKILASDYGLDKFPMGIYEFLVSYGGSWGAKIYKWKMRQAFIAQGCCCVESLQAAIKPGCCEGPQYDDWIAGEVALAAVISDMNCLKQNKTAEAIKRLIDICNRNPCKNC